MLVLNRRDGSAEKFDLGKEKDRKRFNAIGRNSSQVGDITGIWLNVGKQRTTLPFPSRFRRVHFYCDVLRSKDGSRITAQQLVVQAGDIRMIVTSYYEQRGDEESERMTRIDLRRTGKQVYSHQEVKGAS